MLKFVSPRFFQGTLDEEEMLSPEEGYQDEVKMLEDDAGLSIDELRNKYYGHVTEEDHFFEDAQSSSVVSNNLLRFVNDDIIENHSAIETGTHSHDLAANKNESASGWKASPL